MCDILDLHYVIKDGDDMQTYQIDFMGQPTLRINTAHRREARNIEQWLGDLWEDWTWVGPYVCRCGYTFPIYAHALDHVGMAPCKQCDTPTPKYELWAYLCRACDNQLQTA